jgi:hypothetical protein
MTTPVSETPDPTAQENELRPKSIPEAAGMLAAYERAMNKRVREQTLPVLGHLATANMLATGTIGSALFRVNGRVSLTKLDGKAHDSGNLMAGFVLGMDVTESAIMHGRYLQASALVRQEIETMAALDEVKRGVRIDGVTPRVSAFDETIRRLYGQLTDAAHVSNRSIVRSASAYQGPVSGLPEDSVARRYFPVLDVNLARGLYALHTLITIHIAEQMNAQFAEMYGEGFTAEENEALRSAVDGLVQEGFVTEASEEP